MNSKKGVGLWGDDYKKPWYTCDTCWRAHKKSTNGKKKHGQEGVMPTKLGDMNMGINLP